MKITIELLAGNDGHSPTKYDLSKNIAAQERAINNKSECGDWPLLMDTKSILEAIMKEIPK